LLVDRDLRPDAGVAIHRPRIPFPGVVAEVVGPWNRVERPEQLAGADVEGANEPLGVVVGADGGAFAERRSDDDHILRDRRRRVPTDFAGFEIDLLAGAEYGALLQVHNPIRAERADRRPIPRVERDQAVPGRHVENPIVAAAVAPVREPAAGQLSRRDAGAASFT